MSFRFRKFKVYRDAKDLHKVIVFLTSRFPRTYLYLGDQLRRSSLSIVLNIAEGSSKQSDKDFNRYLAIALGSVNETIASLEITLELKLISASPKTLRSQRRDEGVKAETNVNTTFQQANSGFSEADVNLQEKTADF